MATQWCSGTDALKRAALVILLTGLVACDTNSTDTLLRPQEPSFAVTHDLGCPNCGERDMTSAERLHVQDIINWNISSGCSDMKARLQQLLDENRIKVYDGAPKWAETTAVGSQYTIYIHEDHWIRGSGIPIPNIEELGDTFAHEGAHIDERERWGTFSKHSAWWYARKVECYEY